MERDGGNLGEKREKIVGKRIPIVVGSGRNTGKMHNIACEFLRSKKCKEAGANKMGQELRLKGMGSEKLGSLLFPSQMNVFRKVVTYFVSYKCPNVVIPDIFCLSD